MRKIYGILTLLIALLPSAAFASSGCTYPTTHDAWTDKIAGDFLTIADVNQFRCAIEKLESGPVRPLAGSAALPAHAFRDDPDTGMYNPGTNALGFATGGTQRWQISASGHLVAAADATYDIGGPGNRARDVYVGGRIAIGSTQGTGSLANDVTLINNSSIRWVNAAGSSAANFFVSGTSSNNLAFGVPAASNVYEFSFGGQVYGRIYGESSSMGIRFASEATVDHANVSSGHAIIYSRGNGSGKGQLVARFATGAPVVLATEP